MRRAQAQEGKRLTRGQRIKHLRLALGARMGGVPNQTIFGDMVGNEEMREKGGYDGSTVHRWEEKDAAPDLSAIEAMARLARGLGIRYASRTWLAFGDDGVDEARAAEDAPPLRAFADGQIRLASPETFSEITGSSKSDERAGGSR